MIYKCKDVLERLKRIANALGIREFIDLTTPNKELAKWRGCKESECLWVWGADCGYSKVATKLMTSERALYIAKEVDLYL